MTPKPLRLLLSWGPALAWAAFIFYLSSQVWDDAPVTFQVNDKVAHVLLYGVFGVALAWGARRLHGRRVHILIMALGLLYALSDEWHQSFVPMRTPSAGDLVADALGIVAGYLVMSWILRAREKRRGSSDA